MPMSKEIIAEVGEWARDKHAKLKLYIEISRAVRRKYASRSEATYIDPFCGPGKCRVREEGALIDGSPIVAFSSAKDCGVPFSRLHVADLAEPYAQSAASTLKNLGAPFSTYVGPAEQTVGSIIDKLNPHGLHFALLDPYNLGDLPFSVIEQLAQLKRIDLLIHLSTGDLQRNLGKDYMDPVNKTLDRFAPGWRSHVRANAGEEAIRMTLIQHWFTLLQRLNFKESPRMEPVRNRNRSIMYWLIFVSRADIANKFWGAAAGYDPQQRLPL
jgi:three-Cys-motif partner protein